jgi:hypothetical protein
MKKFSDYYPIEPPPGDYKEPKFHTRWLERGGTKIDREITATYEYFDGVIIKVFDYISFEKKYKVAGARIVSDAGHMFDRYELTEKTSLGAVP